MWKCFHLTFQWFKDTFNCHTHKWRVWKASDQPLKRFPQNRPKKQETSQLFQVIICLWHHETVLWGDYREWRVLFQPPPQLCMLVLCVSSCLGYLYADWCGVLFTVTVKLNPVFWFHILIHLQNAANKLTISHWLNMHTFFSCVPVLLEVD